MNNPQSSPNRGQDEPSDSILPYPAPPPSSDPNRSHWRPTKEETRQVVEHKPELYARSGWEAELTKEAESAYTNRNSKDFSSVNTELATVTENIASNQAEWHGKTDEKKKLEAHGHQTMRIVPPKGIDAFVAATAGVGLVLVIVWTVVNVGNMIVDVVQNRRQATLIALPVGTFPLLVELLLALFSPAWRRRLLQFLAACGTLCFAGFLLCMVANYLQTPSMADIVAGRTGPRYLSGQLAFQVGMETAFGALLFSLLLSKFNRQPLLVMRPEIEEVYRVVVQKIAGLESVGVALKARRASIVADIADYQGQLGAFLLRVKEAGNKFRVHLSNYDASLE